MIESVRALGEEWRAVLDAVARRERYPTSDEVKRLGPLVARLSATYNDRSAKSLATDDAQSLGARLQFSFPRDVPKGAGAVRDLAAAGLLRRDRPLRLLDVGAGLGAMTWGIARALDPGARVDAELVDRSAAALDLASKIARERAAQSGGEDVRIRTRVGGAAEVPKGERYDLVIAGQVLSELDRELDEAARTERHIDLVGRWLGAVAEDGALVIVEPALRDRTRHLHRIRDRLAAENRATIFAPCLHAEACPMLARETDWCHEDLPVDLPDWLVPIARAASLRFEGLTFSYLVLRRDGVSLGSLHEGASLLREVSGLFRSKGKTERLLCGRTPGAVGGLRAMRLDRAASEANAIWETAARGDVLRFDPPLAAERPRVERETSVVRIEGGGDRERH